MKAVMRIGSFACAAVVVAMPLLACATGSAAGGARVSLRSDRVTLDLGLAPAANGGRHVLRLRDVRVAEGQAAVIAVSVNGEKATDLYLVPSRSQASSEGTRSRGQNFNVPLRNVRSGEPVRVTLDPMGETDVTLDRPMIVVINEGS